MALLRRELVETLAEDGAYYQVTIHSDDGVTGWAYIPDMGKREVYKRMPLYSYQPISFAWYIREEKKAENK